MILNTKTKINVERVIQETPDPVMVGIFVLRGLLLAERNLHEPPRISDADLNRTIRVWGAASYVGLTVAAGSEPSMIALHLVGRSCQHESFSFSGMASVFVPVDLFVLASRIVMLRETGGAGDVCGFQMAFDIGMAEWVRKNAPADFVASDAPGMMKADYDQGPGVSVGGASALGMRLPGGMG